MQEDEPRFIKAMSDWLGECDNRTRRPFFVQAMMRSTNAKFAGDMRIMMELASESVSLSLP